MCLLVCCSLCPSRSPPSNPQYRSDHLRALGSFSLGCNISLTVCPACSAALCDSSVRSLLAWAAYHLLASGLGLSSLCMRSDALLCSALVSACLVVLLWFSC